MEKKAVIFCGGSFRPNQKSSAALHGADLIICADYGAVYAEQSQVAPHCIVGDMDSIPPSCRDFFSRAAYPVEWITAPSRKDFTDSALAMEIALAKGATEVVLLAATGDRPDHSLANLFLPLPYLARLRACSLIGGNFQCYYSDKGFLTIAGQKGDILSLLPLTPQVEKIILKGTEYPLAGEDLRFGSTRGISNIFQEYTVEIRHNNGVLLAMHYWGADRREDWD